MRQAVAALRSRSARGERAEMPPEDLGVIVSQFSQNDQLVSAAYNWDSSNGFDSATDVDAGTDTFTIVDHGYSDLDQVIYNANGSTIPPGLIENRFYWIGVESADTFKLYNDDAITNLRNISGTGSGSAHTFTVGHMPRFSNSENTYTGQKAAIARFVNGLWMDGKWDDITAIILPVLHDGSDQYHDLKSFNDGVADDMTARQPNNTRGGFTGAKCASTTSGVWWGWTNPKTANEASRVPLDSDMFSYVHTAPNPARANNTLFGILGSEAGSGEDTNFNYLIDINSSGDITYANAGTTKTVNGHGLYEAHKMYTVRGIGFGAGSKLSLLIDGEVIYQDTVTRVGASVSTPETNVFMWGKRFGSTTWFDSGVFSIAGYGKAGLVDTRFVNRCRRFLYDMGTTGLQGMMPSRTELPIYGDPEVQPELICMPWQHPGIDARNEENYEEGFKAMRDFGYTACTVFPLWNYIEITEPGTSSPVVGAGDPSDPAYDWSVTDEIFRLMTKYRITGMQFTLPAEWNGREFYPAWKAHTNSPSDTPWIDITTTPFREAWELFLEALCKKYNDKGLEFNIYYPVIDTINPRIFWDDDSTWDSYATWILSLRSIVNTHAPNWKVGVSYGAGHDGNDSETARTKARWEALIETGGVANFDFLTCTYYPELIDDGYLGPSTWDARWLHILTIFDREMTNKAEWIFVETGYAAIPGGAPPYSSASPARSVEFDTWIKTKLAGVKDKLTYGNHRFSTYEYTQDVDSYPEVPISLGLQTFLRSNALLSYDVGDPPGTPIAPSGTLIHNKQFKWARE
jgi:hypothetical protein